FFSSRRRHTRSDRDWSSDVCSSDLSQFAKGGQNLMVRTQAGYNPQALVGLIKEQIATLDPEQAVSEIATMEENIGESLASRRLRSEERRVGKDHSARALRPHVPRGG